LIYHAQSNLQKAREAYQAGLKANPAAGKIIVELGQINKELNLPHDEQIDFFENNIAVTKTYNQAVSQLVELYVLTGRYNDALNYLQKTHFNSWEGRYGIHQLWVQSNIKLGDMEMNDKNYNEALKYYQQSLEYPLNLEVAEQPNTIHARKYYKIAQALEVMGKKNEATLYYNKIVDYSLDNGNAYQFFRGRAMEALGQNKKANEIYEKMLAALGSNIQTGQNNNDPMIGEQPRVKGNAVNLFTRSLALEGLNKFSESQKLREDALKQYKLVELSAFAPPRSGY
jgi:tetratricopeptide (TPR) repeat protein